ncbi:MAG: hypothetical protein AB7S68_23280 [Polyangiaceae bacterium]
MNERSRPLQALAGYAVDLFRLSRFDVRNPHSLFKTRAIKAMRKRTGAQVLVETGTYLGVTTARCAPAFQTVKTIELQPDLARDAARWLARHQNVEVIQGDADAEVRRLFEQSDLDRVLLFLDGHFSGGVTALGDVPEPAVAILDFLAHHRDRIVGIIVDDFREFGVQPDWPKKWELVQAAEEQFGSHGYRVSIHFDMLLIERA